MAQELRTNLHANSVSQSLFLHVNEWHTLKDKTVTIEGSESSLQGVAAEQALRRAADAEIVSSGEVPKLRRSMMNTNVFTEICRAVACGAKYQDFLEAKFASVWASVPSAGRLFKRLVVVGEAALVQSFLRGYALSGSVASLDFKEADPTSDLAGILHKLEAATAALQAAKAATAAAEESTPCGGEDYRT